MNNVQRESVLAAVQDYAPEVRNGSPPWLITFADLMVLLMCFFVLMLSFSEMDAEKFKIMSGSLNGGFRRASRSDGYRHAEGHEPRCH